MIIIVDFGSQTAHQIGRRLSEIGVASEIVDPKGALAAISEKGPTGVILSGGPSSVHHEEAPSVDPKIFSLDIPILGICYGWQLMAHTLGGEVKASTAEYGPQTLSYAKDLFNLKTCETTVVMSHGDSVVKLPKDFVTFASTSQVPHAAVAHLEKQLFGLQFHPEVAHTEGGKGILKHFALNVCESVKTKTNLNPQNIIEEIKKTVGNDEVICAVSGGVDSTVAAHLISQAIGEQLHPVYVDNGLMRPGTRERVESIFLNPIIIDAEELFLEKLKGQTDPETKRKIIGKLYVDLFAEQAQKFSHIKFLAQGTIYSDVIESKGSKHASQIKSHHNVGGLPKDMPFKLLEPLRPYYKDQVRELGRLSGVPKDLIEEHPFPGPGYAVRIRGEVTKKRLSQVKQADAIVLEEIEKAGWKNRLFQCFALMTGAYSTAVKGDARVFAEVVALRAYESSDVMTSTWAKLPYEVLQAISNRIVNEVPDVSRVVYDITTKPPATMEWE